MKENLEKPENQKEEWGERISDLKKRLSFLRNRDTAKERMAMNEKIASFGKGLIEKYGSNEVSKYVLFHILGGSSYEEGDCEFFDFPDDDSVEKFIESLEEEQEKAEDEE